MFISLFKSPSASGEEPIILAPASWDYPPIITVPASPTMDQDKSDTPGLTDLYLGPDTPGLTYLYLGSQHVKDLTVETPYWRYIATNK